MLEKMFKAVAWLQVAVVPGVIGAGLGLLTWFGIRGTWGVLCGLMLMVVGLSIGVIWANKVSRKHGSVEFMTKVSSTPELDDFNEPKG